MHDPQLVPACRYSPILVISVRLFLMIACRIVLRLTLKQEHTTGPLFSVLLTDLPASRQARTLAPRYDHVLMIMIINSAFIMGCKWDDNDYAE